MTQRKQLERLKMILIELKEFLEIASEVCQEVADENLLVGRTAAENAPQNCSSEEVAPAAG